MFKWKLNAVKPDIQEDTTLEQVREMMLGLMKEESVNHYRMGQLYNHVVKKKLAEKAGYKNAQDYFSKQLADLSQSSLTTYGVVANAFSEEVSARFGVTCLYLLLIYKEAAGLKVNHAEPGGTLIEVPDAKGEVTSKLFSACSVEEMRRAIRRKRKPASSKPVPESDIVLADQFQDAVTSHFPDGVNVKVAVRNQKGDSVFDFMGIPVGQVKTLIEALSAGLSLAPEE